MPRLFTGAAAKSALRSHSIHLLLRPKIVKEPTLKRPLRSETRRLQVLWEYEVLDTVPEEIFDDLTELAAQICNAPIALISLVDEDRQWFKSRYGTTLRETSRDVSFCSYAIEHNGLFIVSDATRDKRFAKNPLVTAEPRVRFYAGMPLVTPDGQALGTLCVLDKVPRQLEPNQERALAILARHVVSQLELRRRSKELAAARKQAKADQGEIARLNRELARARKPSSRAR